MARPEPNARLSKDFSKTGRAQKGKTALVAFLRLCLCFALAASLCVACKKKPATPAPTEVAVDTSEAPKTGQVATGDPSPDASDPGAKGATSEPSKGTPAATPAKPTTPAKNIDITGKYVGRQLTFGGSTKTIVLELELRKDGSYTLRDHYVTSKGSWAPKGDTWVLTPKTKGDETIVLQRDAKGGLMAAGRSITIADHILTKAK